jgi:ferrous iron transport protein A
MNKSILDLKIGEIGYIKALDQEELTSKILSLGLLPNTKIQFIRRAPFGGALYVKVNEHILGIRPEEALQIKLV